MPEHESNGVEEADRARAFWSGTLTFGLVSVPVELYPANRTERVSLRMLAPDGTPLSRRYFCPEEDREIGYDEIVRGYELEDGRYIVLTDEELEELEPRKSRDIDLRLFVRREEIDPIHFERAYYLVPGGESTKAYRLLAGTMEHTGRAGIATFVMRTKEYLVAIVAENGVLRAETLRFPDEVRSPADVDLPEPVSVPRKRVTALERALEKLERDDLASGELEDRNAERLLATIEKKRRSGADIVESAVPADEEEEEEEGVIDLMEVLKRRLQRRESDDGQEADDLQRLSKKDLYERARELDIEGRSSMTKQELIEAIRLSA